MGSRALNLTISFLFNIGYSNYNDTMYVRKTSHEGLMVMVRVCRTRRWRLYADLTLIEENSRYLTHFERFRFEVGAFHD